MVQYRTKLQQLAIDLQQSGAKRAGSADKIVDSARWPARVDDEVAALGPAMIAGLAMLRGQCDAATQPVGQVIDEGTDSGDGQLLDPAGIIGAVGDGQSLTAQQIAGIQLPAHFVYRYPGLADAIAQLPEDR